MRKIIQLNNIGFNWEYHSVCNRTELSWNVAHHYQPDRNEPMPVAWIILVVARSKDLCGYWLFYQSFCILEEKQWHAIYSITEFEHGLQCCHGLFRVLIREYDNNSSVGGACQNSRRIWQMWKLDIAYGVVLIVLFGGLGWVVVGTEGVYTEW